MGVAGRCRVSASASPRNSRDQGHDFRPGPALTQYMPVNALPAPFRVNLHAEAGAIRAVPVGELDMSTAGVLQASVQELLDAGWREVVLDLRELEMLDSVGMKAILVCHRRARARGCDFSLIMGPPAIQRVMEVWGLIDCLHVRAD
jgi:anti-sigma B factor antagonist